MSAYLSFRFTLLRNRLIAMILAISVLGATPKAEALFGVGDIVHDPLMFAGMMGQTGAQIAQLVQTFKIGYQMYQRVSSLAHIRNWKAFARRWLRRNLYALQRAVMYDLHSRGARISSETPRNPILSAMITGRDYLNKAEQGIRGNDTLVRAYRGSDLDIIKRDREAVIARQQAIREGRISQNQSTVDGNGVTSVAPANGVVYLENGTTSASGANNPGDLSYNATPLANGSDGSYNFNTPTTNSGANSEAETFDLPASSEAVTPIDPSTNEPVKSFDLSQPSSKNRALMDQAVTTLQAGTISEMDAAVKYMDKAREIDAEAAESADESDVQGPETYLERMSIQQSHMLQLMEAQLRIARLKEEENQIRERSEALRSDVTAPVLSGEIQNAVSAATAAAKKQ